MPTLEMEGMKEQTSSADRVRSRGWHCFQEHACGRPRKTSIPNGEEPPGTEGANGGSNGSASGEASTSYEKGQAILVNGTVGAMGLKMEGIGNGRASGNGTTHGSQPSDSAAKTVNGTSGGGVEESAAGEEKRNTWKELPRSQHKYAAGTTEDKAGGNPLHMNVSLLTPGRNPDEGDRRAQGNKSSSDTRRGTTSSGVATKGNIEPTGAEQDTSDIAKPTRPTEPLACPRCKSNDTKFCYYNNYNVRQPRHFCRSCQRYWTAGGTLRNVPVGAGRRKNKSSSSGQAGTTGYESSGAQSIKLPSSSGALPFGGTSAPLSTGTYPLHSQSFMAQGAGPPMSMLQPRPDLYKGHHHAPQSEKGRSKSNSPETEEGTHLSLGRGNGNSLGSNVADVGGPRHVGTSNANHHPSEMQANSAQKPGVIATPPGRDPESTERQQACTTGSNSWMHGMPPVVPWGNKPPESMLHSGGNGPQQSQQGIQAWMAQMSSCMWPSAGYFPYGWMQGPQTPGWNAAMAASAGGWTPLPMPNQAQLAYPQHVFPPPMPMAPSTQKGGVSRQDGNGSMQWSNHWMPTWQGGQLATPENLAAGPAGKAAAGQPVTHQKGSGRERREGGASVTLGKHSRSADKLQ